MAASRAGAHQTPSSCPEVREHARLGVVARVKPGKFMKMRQVQGQGEKSVHRSEARTCPDQQDLHIEAQEEIYGCGRNRY